MTFRDIMAEDFKNTILNKGEFAEDVVYTPFGGSPKTITAIVDRKRIEPVALGGAVNVGRTCEIHISNDATEGIESVTKGKDRVALAETEGGSVISWLVVDIFQNESGAWHLLLRK